MLNSREVVTRAIQFGTPDRLPTLFNLSSPGDMHSVGWSQIVPFSRSQKHITDDWGCIWTKTEVNNMGQIMGFPLKDWANIDKYFWPDPDNVKFYDGMEKQFEHSDDKYVLTSIFMLLFERMHALRGFENTLMDLYLEKEKIEMLADRIVEFDIRVIENISSRFPGLVQGLMFSDDWGTETALFINPKLWRSFFKLRYKKIFDACKLAGWHTWMHTCGKVNDIIQDLIDIGLDLINLQQPRAVGIEEVGNKFSGKICFLSNCDIQITIPFKGEKEIREEAKLLMNYWATDKGGFILHDYGDGEAIGAGPDKKIMMYNAFIEFDRWKNRRD